MAGGITSEGAISRYDGKVFDIKATIHDGTDASKGVEKVLKLCEQIDKQYPQNATNVEILLTIRRD